MKEYASIVLRIGMSIIFLWFGFNQIFDTVSWVGWVPQYAYNFPVSPETLVLLNGIFEVVFGIFLLVGLFTKLTAFILVLHLLHIGISAGYNDILIRDLGLAVASFVVFLNGPDKYCCDTFMRKKK